MKRPLALLEVMIGLSLTAILLTTLFSNFRHLIQTNAEMKVLHQEKHWEYVTNLRLNQIFQSISEDANFTSGPHEDIYDKALRFTFNNGIDPDPNFCQEVEGTLLIKKENFCLIIEPKVGEAREEVFLEGVSELSIEYLDPQNGSWLKEWEKDSLPAMVKITIYKKEFTFTLPHANRMAVYS